MKKQRVLFQIKGQAKTPEKTTKRSGDIGNFPEKGDPGLGEKMEAKIKTMKEILTKELEALKNKQTKKRERDRNERINSRITDAEEWISEPEDRMVEITAAE